MPDTPDPAEQVEVLWKQKQSRRDQVRMAIINYLNDHGLHSISNQLFWTKEGLLRLWYDVTWKHEWLELPHIWDDWDKKIYGWTRKCRWLGGECAYPGVGFTPCDPDGCRRFEVSKMRFDKEGLDDDGKR
jgi:hypothetical protein